MGPSVSKSRKRSAEDMLLSDANGLVTSSWAKEKNLERYRGEISDKNRQVRSFPGLGQCSKIILRSELTLPGQVLPSGEHFWPQDAKVGNFKELRKLRAFVSR